MREYKSYTKRDITSLMEKSNRGIVFKSIFSTMMNWLLNTICFFHPVVLVC